VAERHFVHEPAFVWLLADRAIHSGGATGELAFWLLWAIILAIIFMC
jgi:hypothetical protein